MGDRVATVDQLLDRILAHIEPLKDFPQPLLEALDLPSAEEVIAPIDLPSFDNSGMDGYAVRLEDVVTATEDSPVHLPVVGEIGAGQAGILAMSPGTAVKIMTGAPMPTGADSVVPYEWTDRGVAQVRITQAPTEGQHVRRAGEDVAVGDVLIEEGSVLGPRHLGLLASVGRATVRSRPRPRVVILSTGSELRDPGTPLGHDSIYDGNSWLLAAAARRAGAIAYRVGIVPDEPRAFHDALSDQLVRADLVVTSGGVSQGDYDVVKEALAPTGTVWFGSVAMQPGKPQGFGLVGEERVPIFTLPGNPVSSYVSFEAFVLPAIRKLMGRTPYSRPTTRARLTHPISSPAGRRQFVRGAYEVDRGGPFVSPVGGHGSHLIGDLASSNALIVVPEDTTSVTAGEHVQVTLLDEDF
ncbi:MAG TPA: gephyrin-like molybdotransferase Glp [Nocardioides sp.]|nr:gephyrin-like molybdotransferase Glp [Nocardioides sp.]